MLQPGELKRAIVVSTASIIRANNAVDDIEKAAIRRCLAEMGEYEMLDFAIDTAIQETAEQIRQWPAKDCSEWHPPLDAVAALHGLPLLAELLVQMSAAVGYREPDPKLVGARECLPQSGTCARSAGTSSTTRSPGFPRGLAGHGCR